MDFMKTHIHIYSGDGAMKLSERHNYEENLNASTRPDAEIIRMTYNDHLRATLLQPLDNLNRYIGVDKGILVVMEVDVMNAHLWEY